MRLILTLKRSYSGLLIGPGRNVLPLKSAIIGGTDSSLLPSVQEAASVERQSAFNDWGAVMAKSMHAEGARELSMRLLADSKTNRPLSQPWLLAE